MTDVSLGVRGFHLCKLFILFYLLWCPEGDLNPHGLAACGF